MIQCGVRQSFNYRKMKFDISFWINEKSVYEGEDQLILVWRPSEIDIWFDKGRSNQRKVINNLIDLTCMYSATWRSFRTPSRPTPLRSDLKELQAHPKKEYVTTFYVITLCNINDWNWCFLGLAQLVWAFFFLFLAVVYPFSCSMEVWFFLQKECYLLSFLIDLSSPFSKLCKKVKCQFFLLTFGKKKRKKERHVTNIWDVSS